MGIPGPKAKLSPALRGLVDQVESRDDGALAPASLARALRRPLDIDDVADFIRFDAENYVRNLIVRTDRWELRLLCWKPGQSTTVHSHGGSACAFRVVRGSAVERVLGDRDRVWTPGAVIEESSPDLIHQVGNPGGDPLITLHAYSPPLPVEGPSKRAGYEVVIAGGGFAGTALAYHLLRQNRPDLRITLVERGPWIGRGIAYGIDSTVFRLNVPASKMSLDPENPDDFVRWAGAGDKPNAFLERARYGAYVIDRLAGAIRNAPGKLRIFRGEAVSVEDGGVRVATGELLGADVVVVATGLAPRIATGGLVADARVIDAWDECGLATLPREGRVLILGAGLSALDIVSLLNRRGFRGGLTILSRHGLLPRSHVEPFSSARPLSAEIARAAPQNLRGLLAWGRALIREAERRGEPWQHAIDSLRPHIATIWASLPPSDRARFVRSVRPYWDVLRHRAPLDVLEIIERWRAEGRLELLAGSVSQSAAAPGGLDVSIRLASGHQRDVRYDAIVRCIGPALRQIEMETPLIRSLVARGVAVRDSSGLGIVTDQIGALVDPSGSSSDRYFALGAERRASMWESTSVPDISVHALSLARRLVG